MKRCPKCQTTYADDALNFCLQDGTTLVSVGESSSSSRGGDATLILPEDAANYLAQLPTEALDPRGAQTEHLPQTAPTVPVQAPRPTLHDAHLPPPQQKSSNTLLTIGVTAIVILLLALVGIGAALLFRGTGSNTNQKENNNNSPAEKENSNSAEKNQPPNKNDNLNANLPSGRETNTSASLNITATASSTRVPLKAFTYNAAHVLDGDLQTAWIEGVPGPGLGEWIRCDFDREVKLNRVRLTPGYFKNASIWKQNNRVAAATLYFSDGASRSYTFPDQMQWQPLDTGGVRTRFVRLVISEMYPGSVDSEDTAISEISFDWEP
ncbi:MAG: discoidin domain-containing protein [Acidobacteria bacterium]|nr:discoidin domain-containing protein [Acidobacteriota bacterium]